MSTAFTPNKCCMSYDALLPVSIRTEQGEWKTAWQCQTCKQYYTVTFETGKPFTFTYPRIQSMEGIDSSPCVLHHKKLDMLQLRLLMEDTDIFETEREQHTIHAEGRDGMCANCFVDPVQTTDQEGDITYTCQWCGTSYRVLSDTKNKSQFAVFMRDKKVSSDPVITPFEESHIVENTEGGVSPTPTQNTGDTTMPDFIPTTTFAPTVEEHKERDMSQFNTLMDKFLPDEEASVEEDTHDDLFPENTYPSEAKTLAQAQASCASSIELLNFTMPVMEVVPDTDLTDVKPTYHPASTHRASARLYVTISSDVSTTRTMGGFSVVSKNRMSNSFYCDFFSILKMIHDVTEDMCLDFLGGKPVNDGDILYLCELHVDKDHDPILVPVWADSSIDIVPTA